MTSFRIVFLAGLAIALAGLIVPPAEAQIQIRKQPEQKAPGGQAQPRAKAEGKSGWSTTKAPTLVALPPIEPDPAFAAFDRGRYEEAMKLALAAAEKGEAHAATLIGRLYERGLGVAQDDKKAADWYAQAATAGDMHGQFHLGVLLAEGRGVKKDTARAANFFEAAARQGHALAAYNLALIYVTGNAREQDFAKAAEWLKVAAEKDHPQAQYDLGALYAAGRGVPKDDAKAAEWIAKAADTGLTDAQLELGIMLANGRGVEKDEARAISLIRAAAEKGNPVAQNRLARAYAYGVGVEADAVEAAKWHLLGRANGASDGRMDLFLAGLKPEQRTEAERKAQAWRALTASLIP